MQSKFINRLGGPIRFSSPLCRLATVQSFLLVKGEKPQMVLSGDLRKCYHKLSLEPVWHYGGANQSDLMIQIDFFVEAIDVNMLCSLYHG